MELDPEQIAIAITTALAASSYTEDHLSRAAWKGYNPHYGTDKTRELLEDSQRLYDNFRVDTDTFMALLDALIAKGLESTKFVTAAERLLHFLLIVGQGVGYRQVSLVFNRSKRTIGMSFYAILSALLDLYEDVVKKPDSEPQDRITSSGKYWPFFKDCVGALDGSHVIAHTPITDQIAWRNRKGTISQNVLAVVDFDMLFTYVLAGWEGSANDARILLHAREMEGFDAPEGKYYLADAGYPSSRLTLVPYRGARYHLKEWQAGDQRPRTKEELFNLRHSSLRNVVERTFGLLKWRFAILRTTTGPIFDMDTQVQLVYALVAIHNFIRRQQTDRAFAEAEGSVEVPMDDSSHNQGTAAESNTSNYPAENREMAGLRSQMADAMWEQYKDELAARGGHLQS